MSDSRRKRRVLYIVKNYPQLSQTYIKTELRAVYPRYGVHIITTSVPNYADTDVLPYQRISEPEALIAAAREINPAVLHTHYLVQVPIVSRVARALGIPFTVRAHSFDILTPQTKPARAKHLAKLPDLLNDELCLGVLAMPFAVDILIHQVGIQPSKVISSPPVVDVGRFYDKRPNRGGVMNTGACIPKKKMEDFVELAARHRDQSFDLYAIGHDIDELSALNETRGSPVNIRAALPYADMPAEYKKHRWLLYTASFKHNTVGWPMAVVEAWASGTVVCLARIRPDIVDYIGDAGFTYGSLEEAGEIIRRPPPDDVRQRAFDRAWEMDIHRQLPLLTNLWDGVSRN